MYAIMTLLAVVQIIIEMIPISSTGHLYLVKKYAIAAGWLPVGWMMPEWFEGILNIPTIVIILLFFRADINTSLHNFFSVTKTYIYKKKLRSVQKKWLFMMGQLFCFVLCADVVTAIPYFLCKYIYTCGIGNQQQIIGFGLTGFALLLLRYAKDQKKSWCLMYDAIIMGIVQGGAKLFSYSRFGSTLMTGMFFLGFSFRRALYFSFVIYLPLLCASSLKALLELPIESYALFMNPLFLGSCCFAALVAYASFYLIFLAGQKGYLWYLSFYMLAPLLAMFLL